jgi:hypothetical protein
MSMVGFPLLLIPLAVCNIIGFLMPGLSFSAALFTLRLMSGVVWAVTLSDLLVGLGILMLLLEVIKGARPGAKYFMDHLLSLVVFGAAAAEFLLLPQFGTSTYFLLAMLALVDFLSSIALRARRGMQVVPDPAASRRAARQPAAAAREPEFEPVLAPSVPAAASVAESVLLDRPEPKITPSAPSSEVASPELQPGNGPTPPRDAPPR